MRLTHFTRVLVLAGAIVASFGVAAASNQDSKFPELRTTIYGPVQGVNDAQFSGTYYWKGIPFAQPPVGPLRWKAPVAPAKWSKTLSAKQFGHACVQFGRLYGPGANNKYDATIGTTLNTAVGNEDCLTLNIWRPAGNEKNLPVIYYIYGGSNNAGYTADPVYDGATLAKNANAIVVTANYRVGLFGWLNVAQLKSGANGHDDSGNFGTLDTIGALKFIHQNIANFGGDADNVTVMGQSAGAINVYALLVSPLTVNARPKLFHKAVPLSGGISLKTNLPAGKFQILNTVAVSAAQGTALLHQLLIADGKAADDASALTYIATQTPAQIDAYLRAKSPGAIFDIQLTKLVALGLSTNGPIPEGTVLPPDPIAAIAAGNYVKVPVLAGNTRDEGKLFSTLLGLFIVTDAQRFALMKNFNSDANPSMLVEDIFTITDAPRLKQLENFDPHAATLKAGDIIKATSLPVDKPASGYNAMTDLVFNKNFFVANRDNVLDALKSQQANIWYYQFNWAQQPAPWNEVYGAAHLFDMPFIFGNFGPSLFSNVIASAANKAGRLELSDAMMKTLGAFAKHGNPNNPALGVTWNPWPSKLIFDATLSNKKISVE